MRPLIPRRLRTAACTAFPGYRKSPYPLHPKQEKWGRANRYAICFPTGASGAEHLAATVTAGRQHAAAVFGGHASAEAVHLAALNLFGLVGTEHVRTTPCRNLILYGFARLYPNTQDTTKQLLYYNVGGYRCQAEFSWLNQQ